MSNDECAELRPARPARTVTAMEPEMFWQLDETTAAKHGDAALALWCEARGDWDRAHALAQRAGDAGRREGDWVHAYLHRVEGDLGNAGYWYARARRRAPSAGVGLAEERAAILRALLGD